MSNTKPWTTRDAELKALLTKITDEMSHEVYRVGNHPALGVDREVVLMWRDLLIDAYTFYLGDSNWAARRAPVEPPMSSNPPDALAELRARYASKAAEWRRGIGDNARSQAWDEVIADLDAILAAAAPAKVESFGRFWRFLQALPADLPSPEAVGDAGGWISLDWDYAPGRGLSVHMNADGFVGWAAILDGEAFSGRGASEPDAVIPSALLDLFTRYAK